MSVLGGEILNRGTILTYRPFGYERVYLPLYKVADTPFHIQGDDIIANFRKSNMYI